MLAAFGRRGVGLQGDAGLLGGLLAHIRSAYRGLTWFLNQPHRSPARRLMNPSNQ